MSLTNNQLPEGTHTVVLGMGDLNGLLRGKRIPAENWANICESGMAMSNATFAIDMTCDHLREGHLEISNRLLNSGHSIRFIRWCLRARVIGS
mgnify:CR=1 FL=1